MGNQNSNLLVVSNTDNDSNNLNNRGVNSLDENNADVINISSKSCYHSTVSEKVEDSTNGDDNQHCNDDQPSPESLLSLASVSSSSTEEEYQIVDAVDATTTTNTTTITTTFSPSCSNIIAFWSLRQNKSDEEKRDHCDQTPSNATSKSIHKSLSLAFQACGGDYRYHANDDDEYDDDAHYDGNDERKTSSANTKLNLFSRKLNYTEDEMLMEDGDEPLEESDLRPKIVNVSSSSNHQGHEQKKTIQCRSFHIVTTAALPWMTGTAVNPLLRAAYLNKMNREAVEKFINDESAKLNEETSTLNEKKSTSSSSLSLSQHDLMGSVTLCIPWLERESDRKIVYGDSASFNSSMDQEIFIRKWLSESAKLPLESSLETKGIKISFYEARYAEEFLSILPVGDVRELIDLDPKDADVCILEEPEHLNVTMPTSCEPWTTTFRHVIGIMHTNYVAYVLRANLFLAPYISYINAMMTRVHCNKILKLSDTLQIYAAEKECVSNVHGIRSVFLNEGKRRAVSTSPSSTNKIYFIGKLLWAKGLDRLIELQHAFKRSTGEYFEISIIGSGHEKDEIERAFQGRARSKESFSQHNNSLSDLMSEIPKSRHEFRKESIPATFPGRRDHASLTVDYKIFVNPSLTEVLCTTTAEAIAMGKFAIVPYHPSNAFFAQFPNCLMYTKKEEFVANLKYALENEPAPLSPEHSHTLSWNAATERCIVAAMITKREARRRVRLHQQKMDERALMNIKGPVVAPFRRCALDSIEIVSTNETIPEDNYKSLDSDPRPRVVLVE